MIDVKPFSETYIHIDCADFGVEQELSEYFTFFAPNYKFMPAYRNKLFDGKIRLFNMRTKKLYKGLLHLVYKFAVDRGYEIKIDPRLNNCTDISLEEVKSFMDGLQLSARGEPLKIRDYQYGAVWNMLRYKRSIQVAATSAGKSAMIYSKIRYHLERDERVLLIVPTIDLVNQMFADFKDYSSINGFPVEDHTTLLYSGRERIFENKIIVSTWQTLASMLKNDRESLDYLIDQTDVLIGDEAHQFKSKVVSSVVEAFNATEWRVGTTGTLDGVNINELTLTGLFGPAHKVVTAKELMDAGQVTKLEIKMIVLKHPEHIRQAMKKMSYQEEIRHIFSNQARNEFIAKLAIACTGNTLILYNFVDKHGKLIEEEIRKRVPSHRNVYFISGSVENSERERIRTIVETEKDSIILATSSLFSTGINIPSLANIIFTAGGKSNIRIRQSIGRGLRLKEGKFVCKVFDISDDYRYKSWKNHTFRHMEERVAIYIKEHFEYKVILTDLNY